MNTTRSSILVAEVPGYTELQRQMRDAVSGQHPEWTEADGKSPNCDYYESRFAELLLRHLAHARALNRTYSERLSAAANSSIPVGYAEARNIVFHEQQVRSDDVSMKNLTDWRQ